MSEVHALAVRPKRGEAALVLAAALALVATAGAQRAAFAADAPTGHIEFDYPGAAKATVEVDLSRDTFGSLFGIGDGALAGVAEALSQSTQAQEGSETIRQAAQQAASAREVVAIAKDVIDAVRIRIYHGLESSSAGSTGVIAHYDEQLESGGWQSAVRVREGDKNVRISTVDDNGAIKGLFIVAAEGDDLVLVNVTCDISPENAKKLSAAAVKSGLAAGLEKKLERAMKHMDDR